MQILDHPEIGQALRDLGRVRPYRWYGDFFDTLWDPSKARTYEQMIADVQTDIWLIKRVSKCIDTALLHAGMHERNLRKWFSNDMSYARFALSDSEKEILRSSKAILDVKLRSLKSDYRRKKEREQRMAEQEQLYREEEARERRIEREYASTPDRELVLIWIQLKKNIAKSSTETLDRQRMDYISRHFGNNMRAAYLRFFSRSHRGRSKRDILHEHGISSGQYEALRSEYGDDVGGYLDNIDR